MRKHKRPKIKQIDELKIWIPEDDDTGFLISDEGGWAPGAFDSEQSAIAGHKAFLETMDTFCEMQRNVNYIDRGNRLITMADIEGLL